MTDRFQDHDGELLSAWLAGDLDDAAASALERRLEEDPALGARLDVLSETVGRLQGLDEIALPHATADRLRARLAAERSRENPSAWSAVADGRTAPPAHPAATPTPEGPAAPPAPPAHPAAPAADGPAAARPPATPTPPGPPRVSHPASGSVAPAPDGRRGSRLGAGTGSAAPGSPRPAGPGRPPRDAASHAARRRRRRGALAGIAAVALVAVVGLGALLPVLRGGGAGVRGEADSAVMAQQEAGEEGAAAAGSASEFALEEGEREAGVEAPPPNLAPGAAALPGPVVVEAGAALDVDGATSEGAQEPADEDALSPALQEALRSRFLGTPETESLLGRPVQEARTLGDAAVAALDAEPALPSIGAPPSVCLATVLGADDTAVPVRVERFALNGQDVLAYVTVRAAAGSPVLDRTEVAVVDPETCGVVAEVG